MDMQVSFITELCTYLFKHRALLLEGKQLRKQGQTHPTNLNQMVGTVLILFSAMLSVGGNLLQGHSKIKVTSEKRIMPTPWNRKIGHKSSFS